MNLDLDQYEAHIIIDSLTEEIRFIKEYNKDQNIKRDETLQKIIDKILEAEKNEIIAQMEAEDK